jgi:cytochrome c oxidase cbb3-type subunit 1
MIRLLGGVCFLSGMFVMAYNVLKTIQNKKFVDAPIPTGNLAAAH